VEQHVNVALHVADTATVLNRGSIVLRGPAAELFTAAERLEAAYFGSADDETPEPDDAPT
jgi:branched-chain amino acid transport system ATP-binding protein